MRSDEKGLIEVYPGARPHFPSWLTPNRCVKDPFALWRDLRRHPADLVLARRQNLRWPIRGIRRSIRTPDVNLPGSGIGISVRDSWTEVNVEKGTAGSQRSRELIPRDFREHDCFAVRASPSSSRL